jgi:hypothetical protein
MSNHYRGPPTTNDGRQAVPEMRASPKFFFWASKKLVTGPNGIMVAQTFCEFFLWKKDIRYQYINSFQINCFLSITLKFILTLVSRGWGLFKVILVGTGVQLKLRKHPNACIAIKWNLNLPVITFLTTLTPLARVVLRNDASPSDGDNKRLVCVRGDQCHDHIKDIRKRVD